MTTAFQKVYTKITQITKATCTLNAQGVGNDELAIVDGRLAQVVKIWGNDITLQVFSGTEGIPTNAEVTFLGKAPTLRVGDDLCGRFFNAFGDPIDGGPAVDGEEREIGGPSVNPVRRKQPSELIATGIAGIDLNNTLVSGQKIPFFADPDQPYNQVMANVALIAPLLGPLVGAAWIHVLPWEGMFVLFAALAAISFFGLQRAMPETATRIGEKLSLKELGRDYKLVLKNGRFVAGALALGFVSLPLLAWIAQSPIIIITGEQLSSYEYGLLQVPIFGALIAGNLLLARLTSRRTVRSLIIMGGWPIMIGLLVAAAATVISSHAYLWMTAGLSIYAFGIGLANAGLVRLTLFASDMSKGTVSAAMGMLQMLIFTVGIEISKHAWLNGGNGLFNLFNLVNGILWLSLMVIFLKDKQMGNSHEG